jgi:phage shock protein A
MFKRIWNLIKGMLGLAVTKAEASNPEALLELEKENLRKQIAQYNQGLASHAALVERLISQVEREEKRERDLKAKATAHIKAGNNEPASRYALSLQEIRRELEDNRAQLVDAEKTYKELTKARDVTIQEAKRKIESLRFGIQDMKIQKATAELSEMATGMISELGGSGETLDRLEGIVQDQREQAAGRARVARDSVDMSEVKLKESEENALADMALADLASELGVTLDEKTEEASEAPQEKEPESESEKAGM